MLVVLLCAAVNSAGMFIGNVTFSYAVRANINPGIMAGGFFLQAMFASIGAYILFKEKTAILQMLGMGFLVGCVVSLSFS